MNWLPNRLQTASNAPESGIAGGGRGITSLHSVIPRLPEVASKKQTAVTAPQEPCISEWEMLENHFSDTSHSDIQTSPFRGDAAVYFSLDAEGEETEPFPKSAIYQPIIL